MVEPESGTSEQQPNMKLEADQSKLESAASISIKEAEPPESVKKKLVLKFLDQMAKLPTPITSPIIYKVPEEFRTSKNEKCFDPVSIPIGPLHHVDPDSPAPAQQLKQRELKNFIHRVNQDINGLADMMMSGFEARIRDCYRDINPKLEGSQLLKIMLLDGSFIVELLLSQDMSENSTADATVEKVPFYTLKQDLLKIENQIPFLVLTTLAEFAASRTQPPANKSTNQESNQPQPQPQPELIDRALHFFNIRNPEKFNGQPTHLLDLVMKTVFYDNTTNDSTVDVDRNEVNSLVNEKFLKEAKTASEMDHYGIKFEAVESDVLTQIDFSKGILKIPKIFIEESTPDLYWNFLVHEMRSSKRVFASYIVLMDTLINDEKDVQILLDAKILVSRINDTKRLVYLFNDLSVSVKPKDFHFAHILRKVNIYCESKIPRVRGYLVRNFYDARWDVLNSSLIFFFTVTQTIFSVLSYSPHPKPNKNGS